MIDTCWPAIATSSSIRCVPTWSNIRPNTDGQVTGPTLKERNVRCFSLIRLTTLSQLRWLLDKLHIANYSRTRWSPHWSKKFAALPMAIWHLAINGSQPKLRAHLGVAQLLESLAGRANNRRRQHEINHERRRCRETGVCPRFRGFHLTSPEPAPLTSSSIPHK